MSTAAPEVSASEISWEDSPASSRDRSLAARLERSIESGAEDLEPAGAPLAAVRAWLDTDVDARDVREILADLALLPALQYDEVRVHIAKSAGIRTSTLDRERDELLRTSNDSAADAGISPMLADVDPWPKSVEGGELLAELARIINRYIVVQDGVATALALWVLFAHAHDAAHISPLLALTSPEKRCGKTTVLSMLGRLVPRPLPASNISAAALFRAVEKYRPTLLVDEADTFLRCRDDLRGVLNAGHTRSMAYTVRCDGDDHDARTFSTWAPKAIALIGRLPDTLADRAIVVPMRRRSPGEHVEHLRLDRLDELEPLRRMAARWTADNLDALHAADPDVPTELHDRAADNWRPLLAIADCAGGQWPESGRRTALLLSGGRADDDGSVRIVLLSDLRAIFKADERMASADIVAALREMEHRPWIEWRGGEPLTPRGVARLLEPFGVKPRQLWIGGAKTRGYRAVDLEESWVRYLSADDGEPAVPQLTPASGSSGRISASAEFVPNPQTVGVEISTGCEIDGDPCERGVLPNLPDTVPGTGLKEQTPNPERFAAMEWREQRAARLREIRAKEDVA